MAVPKSIHDAKGLWKGISRLNLPYLPEDQRVSESPSELHVDLDKHDAYATIAYTWAHDGKPQEGTMILAMDGGTKAVEIGWVDSWHQSAAVMHLKGKEEDGGAVRTKGDWAAGDETWGWSVDLDVNDGTLTLSMDVFTPKGEREWAVKATYKRG